MFNNKKKKKIINTRIPDGSYLKFFKKYCASIPVPVFVHVHLSNVHA